MIFESKKNFYVDKILFNFKYKGFKTELEIIKIERPNETWNFIPYDIEDIYSLQDDEIKQLLHETTEPIYKIFDEIQSKKKDWMPDEELDELLRFESFLDNIFFLDIYKPHDYCEFDQVIAGIKKEYNGLGYTIKRAYKIEDFFSQFDCEIENLINQYSSDNDFIEDGLRKYFIIRFKLFMIFWTAFDINEDLLDVINFWREFSQYRVITNHEGCIRDDKDYENKYEFDKDYLEKIKLKFKRQKLKFQEYQKSYFYNDVVGRAAYIFKEFTIEYNQKILLN